MRKREVINLQRLMAGVFVIFATTIHPVLAVERPGPFGITGNVVGEAELATIRGRFVDGRNITFFGIRMSTEWQRNNGQNFTMEMHVNVDMSQGRYQPQLTMLRSRDIGRSVQSVANSPLDNVSDNGALESISGVVQNIQVAGDNNLVHNGVQWVVTDTPSAEDQSDLVEVRDAGNQTHLSDDGVATHLAVGSEGIGYQVDIPDIGSVSQQINRSQLAGGSLLQSTQLNSDLNQVLNQIGLTVELSSKAAERSRLLDLHRTLGNIRGL